MKLAELPAHAGLGDTEGLNHVLNAVVHDEQTAKEGASLLEQNPRGVIRRLIRLNRYQNAWLAETFDEELKALVNPVVKALKGPDALKFRIVLHEEITTHSPLRIKKTITIET